MEGQGQGQGVVDPSEIFWRTVAPEVHHEMREYLIEGPDQPLATPPKPNVPLLLMAPPQSLRAIEPQGQRDLELSSVAHSLSLAAQGVNLKVMGGRRPLGSLAVSRWFNPDGSSEWRRCILQGCPNDASSFIIQWTEGPGDGKTKEVSRLNILFDDEDEESLVRLHEAAVNLKLAKDEVQKQAQLADQVPRFDVPDIPPQVAGGIFSRVGGKYEHEVLIVTSNAIQMSKAKADDTCGLPSPSAMDRLAFNPALGDLSGPRRVKNEASAIILDNFFKHVHEASALDLSGNLLPSSPRLTQATLSGPLRGKRKGSASAASSRPPNPNLGLYKKYGGWKLDPLGTWRSFPYLEAEEKLRKVLGEANDEYRTVHALFLRRAEFEQETGLPFPQAPDLQLALASLNGDRGPASDEARSVVEPSRLHPRGVILAAFHTPAQYHRLQQSFTSHSLIADPFILSAWHQSQHYITDVTLRDIFGLNLLPIRYSTTDDIRERIEYRHYLESRRQGDWSLPFRTKKKAQKSQGLSVTIDPMALDPDLLALVPSNGVVAKDEICSISLVEFLNIQEGTVNEEVGMLWGYI